MSKTDLQPTLLVFTLGARTDCARRSLLPERWRREELSLRQACLEAALAAGRDAGCRLELSCPTPLAVAPEVRQRPQPGPDFGSRLAGALDAAFAAGGPVVVVGTDVPGLTAGHVRRALDALDGDDDRVVLGPSPDGGFYLLASARPLDDLLAGVRWCRCDTLVSLRRALEAAGRTVLLLEPLSDLDGPADLERWLSGKLEPLLGWRALVDPLRRLLARHRRPLLDPGPSLSVIDPATAAGVRGPPAVLPC